MKVTVPANRAADDVAGTCKVFGDTMLARVDEFREAVQRRDPQAYWRQRDSYRVKHMKRTRHEAPQDTLTPKQRAFVAAYGSGRYASATAAARAAGYSPRSARCMVHDLVRHPLIVAELEKIAAEVRKQTVYDATAAHAEAERVAEFAKKTKNANAYLGAVTLKARLAGLLVERAQIDLNQTVDIGAALAEAKARARPVLEGAIIEHDDTAMLPSPDQANADRARLVADKFQGQ